MTTWNALTKAALDLALGRGLEMARLESPSRGGSELVLVGAAGQAVHAALDDGSTDTAVIERYHPEASQPVAYIALATLDAERLVREMEAVLR